MARLRIVFYLQLLLGTFRLCLLQRSSTDVRSVHPGGNITLPCNITAGYEILWFHQSSEELKLLVSAGRRKLDKHFTLSHNVDEVHYDGVENISAVDLVITGVNETDSGLYYCGGRTQTSVIQFGKAIRLSVGDVGNPQPDVSELSAVCWLSKVMMCVCLFCILLNIICMCVFCCRLRGKSPSSRSICRNIRDSAEKEEDVQYSSLEAEPRATAARNTASASSSVTYAKVLLQPCKRLPV